MDDTRDIAIRADESGKSAHKRLDAYNGQIKRLGDSHERIRTDVTAQVGTVRMDVVELRDDFNQALYDPENGLVVRVTDLAATLRTTLKVAGTLVGLLVIIIGGVSVYAITHLHHATSPPPQAVVGK